MLKHDFYADPTVFDHWHSHTSSWLGQWLEKVRPYAWSMGFSALSGVCLLVFLGILAYLLSSSWNEAGPSAWNRMLAQTLTLLLASIAAYRLLKLAVSAWPEDCALCWPLNRLAGLFAWRRQVAVSTVTIQAALPERTDDTPTPVDARALREFFQSVRKAGVNVTIAKALFAAGVHSAQQVYAARNRDLLEIQGVGPATVRKLRRQFGSA